MRKETVMASLDMCADLSEPSLLTDWIRINFPESEESRVLAHVIIKRFDLTRRYLELSEFELSCEVYSAREHTDCF